MRFAHKGLRALFERDRSRGLPTNLVPRIRRILADLEVAERPGDLDLPGYRLHRLRGDRAGQWSIRVSANWRIVFRFDGAEAVDVELTDYHQEIRDKHHDQPSPSRRDAPLRVHSGRRSHRHREACGDDFEKLRGIVEIDETYLGGKEKNKHGNKQLNAGRGTVGKQPVLGMRERGGKSIAMPVARTDKATLHAKIARHVAPGSKVYTDEYASYRGLDAAYEHHHVKHSAGEYVGANDIHINAAESMWALLKRGLYGTWHKASRKHLHRYVNECTFRLSEGNVKVHTLDRLDVFVDRSFDRRLTYRKLIA